MSKLSGEQQARVDSVIEREDLEESINKKLGNNTFSKLLEEAKKLGENPNDQQFETFESLSKQVISNCKHAIHSNIFDMTIGLPFDTFKSIYSQKEPTKMLDKVSDMALDMYKTGLLKDESIFVKIVETQALIRAVDSISGNNFQPTLPVTLFRDEGQSWDFNQGKGKEEAPRN
ncbi:hypothetical protein L3V86_00090 [Thiotrichales bacterium 19S11-10]|nr:hypothetical protein [Thiotrichales bacterium 19S11-10]